MTNPIKTVYLHTVYYGNNFGRGARVVASTLSNHEDRDKWYKALPTEYYLGGDEIPWAGWVNAPPSEKGVGVFRRGDTNILVFLHKTEHGDPRDGGGYLYQWVIVGYEDMLALGGNWVGLLDKIRDEHPRLVRQFNPSELAQLAQIPISPAQLHQAVPQLTRYDLAEAILATCFIDEEVSISIEGISTIQDRARTAQQIINLLPVALRGILPFTLAHMAYGNSSRTWLDFDTPNRAKYQVDWNSGKNNLPKSTHIVASWLIYALKEGRIDTFHQYWDDRLAIWMRQEKGKWRVVMQLWANWLQLEANWGNAVVDEATFKTLFELLQSDVTITPQTRYSWLTQSIEKLLSHPNPALREPFTNGVCQQIQQLEEGQMLPFHQDLTTIFHKHGERLIRWMIRWRTALPKKWDSRWDDLMRQFTIAYTQTIFQQGQLPKHEEWLVFIESQLDRLITPDDWYRILEIGIQARHSTSNILLMRYVVKKLDVPRIQTLVNQYAAWISELPGEYSLLVSSKAGFADDRVMSILGSFGQDELEKIIQFQLNHPTALMEYPKFVELLVNRTLMSKSPQSVYENGLMLVHERVKAKQNFNEVVFFHLFRYFMTQNKPDDAQLYYNLLNDTQFDALLDYLAPYMADNPRVADFLAVCVHNRNAPVRQFRILFKQVQMNQPCSVFAVGHVMASLKIPEVTYELSQNQYRREYIRVAFNPNSRLSVAMQNELFQWMTALVRDYWMQHDIQTSTYWLVLCCQFGQGREQYLHDFFARSIIAQSSVDDLKVFLEWGRLNKETKPDKFVAIEPLFQLAKNSLQQVRTRELADNIMHKEYLIIPFLRGLTELEKAMTDLDEVYRQMGAEEINLQQLTDLLQRANPNQNITINELLKRLGGLQIQLDDLVKDFEREDIPKFGGVIKRKSAEVVVDDLLRGENKTPKSRLAIWLSIIRGWIR